MLGNNTNHKEMNKEHVHDTCSLDGCCSCETGHTDHTDHYEEGCSCCTGDCESQEEELKSKSFIAGVILFALAIAVNYFMEQIPYIVTGGHLSGSISAGGERGFIDSRQEYFKR